MGTYKETETLTFNRGTELCCVTSEAGQTQVSIRIVTALKVKTQSWFFLQSFRDRK